jgi:hypothetical protein
MRAAENGTKRRWAWACAGALLIAGGIAALFSVSVSRPPAQGIAAARPKPTIEVAERREKSALDDEATLLDPTALFQPTRWNTARMDVAPPEPSSTFQSYRVPPKLGFADSDLKLGRVETVDRGAKAAPRALRSSLELPDPVVVPSKAADALDVGLAGSLAVGFGRTDRPLVALPVYGAQVEIVALNPGQIALTPRAMAEVQALAARASPPRGKSWSSVEFVAAVDAAGLVAPAAITRRSGFEDVDSYFQNFLVQTLRVGERLSPGFYRISVGP